MQRLVRVAAMLVILHSAVDTADRVVEARTAEDLSPICQSVCGSKLEAFSLDSYPLDDVVLQIIQS